MTSSPRPLSQWQSTSGCRTFGETSKHFSFAISYNTFGYLLGSNRSQACADEAMQRDKAYKLSIILHWEESDLPRRPLHLLRGSSPGISQLMTMASATTALGACYSLCCGHLYPNAGNANVHYSPG